MSSSLETFEPYSRHVLIIVENLPVPLDRRVWLEATTLISAGYQVTVICPTGRGWEAEYEVIDGVHIYRYPAPPEAHSGAKAYAIEYSLALWHMLRLSIRVWRERGFEVIHGCNPPDLIWIIALLFRPFGVRYLFDHHDVCPELFEAKFGKKGALHKLMLWWERLTFACARTSIATNESFRQIAIKRGKMKPEDVFVVRSAPKVEKFEIRPADPELRKGFGTVLGYVGVIGQQEGMDLLIEAVDHLVNRAERPDIHALIVGFGPELERVKAEVISRQLDAHFTFTGALYGEDLLRALNSCDIGVAPDPKNAMNDISTMNKVMEYMTLEKPVVQFDLTEGRVSAGTAALYAKPNDPEDFAAKIAWLIDHPELAQDMGKRGRERVFSALSWEHSVPQLLAAYDRVFK